MPLLSEFFHDRYLPRNLLDRSYHSEDLHRRAIKHLSAALGRPAVVADLCDDNLARLARWHLEHKGNRCTTANRDQRHLKAVWRFASECGAIDTLPKIRALREPKKSPRAWDIAELGALRLACRKAPGSVGDLPACDFWEALVVFLYDTGLRRGAALNLTPDCLVRDLRLVVVPAEIQKQGSDQILRYSEDSAERLERIYHPARRWLFPWPFDRYERSTWTCLHKHFRRIVKAAGLDNAFGLFHRIRKSRASYGDLLAPGSATAALGHSSPIVTRRSYLDPRIVGQVGQDVVDRLPRPASGPIIENN